MKIVANNFHIRNPQRLAINKYFFLSNYCDSLGMVSMFLILEVEAGGSGVSGHL